MNRDYLFKNTVMFGFITCGYAVLFITLKNVINSEFSGSGVLYDLLKNNSKIFVALGFMMLAISTVLYLVGTTKQKTYDEYQKKCVRLTTQVGGGIVLLSWPVIVGLVLNRPQLMVDILIVSMLIQWCVLLGVNVIKVYIGLRK